MSPKPIQAGDDHNLLANRTVGDPHPQYHLKAQLLIKTEDGDLVVPCGLIVNDERGPDCDLVFHGDTIDNVIFGRASNNRVGIHTSSPQGKLHVEHAGSSGTGLRITGGSAATGFLLSVTGNSEDLLNVTTGTKDQVILGADTTVVSGFYHTAVENSLFVNSSMAFRRRQFSAPTTANARDNYIAVFTGGGPITLTLPDTSVLSAGHFFIVKNIGTNGNDLTIQGNGTDTVDPTGQTLIDLEGAMYFWDGTSNWEVV